MNLLVTGAGGQLGKSIIAAKPHGNINYLTPHREHFDITDKVSVNRYFAENPVDAVIHMAAFTAVDDAERVPEICKAVNAYGTENVARECIERKIYMIYISTDYVFDGRKSTGYVPSDKTNPLSVYGRTKRDGELYTLRSENNLVIRTSWLFGKSPRNFVDTITKLAKSKNSINVVCDQIGNPTFADDLAALILDCIEIQPSGIIHAANEGCCTRAEFAREIIRLQGIDCQVNDILSDEFPSAAKRPNYSILDMSSLDELGIKRLPNWKDALRRYLLGEGRIK
ncbi:MAG: dTDP-4-dehydrorhamnose reductase [Oscillospiraceae bacterium]|nr:dTDP-4-dehydrorhamnose reductase [Oscillospiraceae bacterium]